MIDLGGNDLDLVSELLAEGKSGAADGAEHVASIGQFLDAHLFTKSNITELAASRAFDLANLKFATDRSLTEGQSGIEFEISSEGWHGLKEGKLIETVSQ